MTSDITGKECSKCGKPFGCHANEGGCWCEAYKISIDTLTTLRNDYADCLCPECLATYEQSKEEE